MSKSFIPCRIKTKRPQPCEYYSWSLSSHIRFAEPLNLNINWLSQSSQHKTSRLMPITASTNTKFTLGCSYTSLVHRYRTRRSLMRRRLARLVYYLELSGIGGHTDHGSDMCDISFEHLYQGGTSEPGCTSGISPKLFGDVITTLPL